MVVSLSACFFFSSRRRHTRLVSDWSQTCALPISPGRGPRQAGATAGGGGPRGAAQIGRASCRESVDLRGGRSNKKKREKRKAAMRTETCSEQEERQSHEELNRKQEDPRSRTPNMH